MRRKTQKRGSRSFSDLDSRRLSVFFFFHRCLHFLIPAHPRHDILLPNHLHTHPDSLHHQILHPIIVVPQIQPFSGNGLRDGGVRELVGRVGEVQDELELGLFGRGGFACVGVGFGSWYGGLLRDG